MTVTNGSIEPYVFADLTGLESGEGDFPFPDLTDYLALDGSRWEQAEGEWFVDISGFGRTDEPALTMDQFRSELLAYVREHPDHGFGLSGIGQFQAYVSAYKRVV